MDKYTIFHGSYGHLKIDFPFFRTASFEGVPLPGALSCSFQGSCVPVGRNGQTSGERPQLFFTAMVLNNPIRREIHRQLEGLQGSQVILHTLQRTLPATRAVGKWCPWLFFFFCEA